MTPPPFCKLYKKTGILVRDRVPNSVTQGGYHIQKCFPQPNLNSNPNKEI